jgi:hypothetical protein
MAYGSNTTNPNGTNRAIKYTSRDFDTLKNSLIEYSKTYFPTTYNDFSPNSPGSMFIEMAAYVGDVLSFYLDNQIQETFLQYARQESNLYDLAYMMGYKPQVTTAANTVVDVYQQVPYKTDGGDRVPDYDYALIFPESTTLTSNDGVGFVIQDSIDFTYSSSQDPTEVSVYATDGTDVTYFLLKKKRKAISATIKTESFTFTDVERYPTITINDTNIIGIFDITDSDGNEWTEVPYLAQETIFEPVKNTSPFGPDPNTESDAGEVPYLLRLKKVPRRFVSRFKSKTRLDIQFGAGTNQNNIDEVIVPNPDNVGIGLPNSIDKTKTAFNPSNFLFSGTYGIAPSNTTLTVRYLVGGGVGSNVASNTINFINTANVRFQQDNLTDTGEAQNIYDSIIINNPEAATGGSDGDSVEEIRNNSLANFGSQNRTVTEEDYLTRVLSLPSQYGTIAKAYIEPEKTTNLLPGEIQSSLNLYVLSYNASKQLINASSTLKQNLKTYISEYRTIGDSIKIRDAFIVNIGIDFEIVILPNFNSNEVINNCITAIKNYFNINNQQINQPIYTRELYLTLDKIQGVQTVNEVKIINKSGGSYSQYGYDIDGATRNRVIYPSLDPCIFEIKYPDVDIRGRATTL